VKAKSTWPWILLLMMTSCSGEKSAIEKIQSAYFDADSLQMSVKACAENPGFADKTQIAIARFAFLKLDIERRFGKQAVIDLHKESFARFVTTMPSQMGCEEGLDKYSAILRKLAAQIDKA
jgi:hypothetical protein